MKKLLVYVEPIALNNNPLRHEYWANLMVETFQDADGMELILAASPLMCQKFSASFSKVIPLNTSRIYQAADFDRNRYVRRVCGLEPGGNAFLEEAFDDIRSRIAPDFVISWTDNAVLKKAFGDKCHFIEISPVPRYLFRPSAYIDPFGQHRHSALSIYEERGDRFACDDRLDPVFQARWGEHMERWSDHIGMRPWFNTVRDGRRIILAALQPTEDFGYIGCNFEKDDIAVLRQIASRDPEAEMVVPVWHPACNRPGEALIEELTLEHPNVRIPPESCRFGTSEMAIHSVDEVVTVSSNVAFTAALMGKGVTVLGDSRFSALAAGTKAGEPRTDLLAFALNGYSTPIEAWAKAPQSFIARLEQLRQDPYSLFTQREPAGEALFNSHFSI